MIRKLSSCLIVSIILLFSTIISAQGQSKIHGTVTDNGKPLTRVTVRLFNNKDSVKAVHNTITDNYGIFEISNTVPGNYVLIFTHTGFTEKILPVVIVGDSTINTGQVQLSPSTGLLKEVSVKTQRPLVEQNDDKIVFNVEDDPASRSETAMDLLRKTPFVTVDGEENIQVNGKRNFKVLLNGKESSMFARNVKEVLRGFPGAMISKIEVITSPSAKYDGEGIGGLINIITKKKVVGYNGTLSNFYRTMDKLNNTGINGNAKVGKFGASVFFNVGKRWPVSQDNSSVTVTHGSGAYNRRSLEGQKKNGESWKFGNAELSIEIDSLNTLSTYANVNSGTGTSILHQTITTEYSSGLPTKSTYDLENNTRYPGISTGIDYIRKFKNNKDKEFSIRFFGEFGENESFLNSFQDNPVTDRYIKNNSLAHNNQYTLQTDYIIPLKKGARIETGVKGIFRNASSDFESLIKYDGQSNFKNNPGNTDKFEYRQNVLSLYGMYSFKINKSGLRIGSRLEHTKVNGDFITSNTVVDQSYLTLLPNIQFTSKLSKVLTLVLTYSKRLQRPYIYDLNPFVNNNDSLKISYGNPQLGPQTVHSFSAQTRFVKGFIFGGLNLESSYSDNKILEYSTFDPATGIRRTTSMNIGKEFQSSANLNLNVRINTKWNIAANSSIRYSHITNNALTAQSNHGVGGYAGMNTTYRFTTKFSVGSFVGWFRDPVGLQVTYPATLWYNIAFNYKFLKDKLNVSLRGVNYLEKTRDFVTTIKAINFTTTDTDVQLRRGIALALTWNFGKLTENVSKKKGVTNDDLYTKPQQSTNQQ